MDSKEKPLFEIDDDAWWIGKMTVLIWIWFVFLIIFWVEDFDLLVVMHSNILMRVAIPMWIVYTFFTAFKIAKELIKRNQKLIFYTDRIVKSRDNFTIKIDKINEGYLRPYLIDNEKNKVGRRNEGFRKYTTIFMAPIFYPFFFFAIIASQLSHFVFRAKYQYRSKRQDRFHFLSLNDRDDFQLNIVLGGPNDEKIENYLRQVLHIGFNELPTHYFFVPKKSPNLNTTL